MTRATRLTSLAMLAALGACDLGSTTIPRTDPVLVVHAVLNPSDRRQLVLVEESLTGRQAVVDSGPYNPANPIATGNGIPVSGAIVELRDPDGIVMTGTELRQANKPTGIYVIDLNAYTDGGRPMQIKMGRRYELSVAAQALKVTGSTLVPKSATPPGIPIVSFNRDHQSVSLPIKDVEFARAYWVRVEAPVSAFSVFTLDQEVAISGDTRNYFTEELLRVFFPGFLQTLTVAAVDTNLYDYYRSGNDPFSGSGLINHLDGGLGVFGSVAIVEKRQLDVTQDPTGDPVEGIYTRRTAAGLEAPHTIQLFVEALAPNAGGEDRISGSYIKGTQFAPVRGAIFGGRKGDILDLRILEAQSTGSVAMTLKARVAGDSLHGTLSSGSQVVYVRSGR
ncbi:MAG TPA: DUF4249 family protein [Gemmatimonadaceae bacterium]|nr:DUF4249 family protein [Gemmatimonadaceae bacterium]